MAANLYRIAQEAVSNAVRHGKPTRIEIRLEQQGNLIRLSVRDDGEWKATPRSGPGGLGLHIMSYRAGILGGKLSVGPEPDGGTLALCEIPLRTD
jgi:two-component system CheB/CheR fusion protein